MENNRKYNKVGCMSNKRTSDGKEKKIVGLMSMETNKLNAIK
jgi:hypothetical protein